MWLFALVLVSAAAFKPCRIANDVPPLRILFMMADRFDSPAASSSLSPAVPRIRKTATNKYSQFSKRSALDPIEEAMQKADSDAIAKTIKNAAPSRGTTVPTLSASPTKARNSLKSNTTRTSKVPGDIYQSLVPSDPFTFGYVQIGKFLGPHGVHGEIKVLMETDFADERLSPGSVLYIRRPNRLTPRPVSIESGRRQASNHYLVKIHGISTRLGAMVLKDYAVYARQEDRPALKGDEYLVRDLVGLSCYTLQATTASAEIAATTRKSKKKEVPKDSSVDNSSSSVCVGKVVGVVLPEDLCDSPSLAKLMHSMLEIQKIGSAELCLLPLVPQIVIHVDIAGGRILLNPPAGLLDMVYIEKPKPVALRGFLPEKSIVLSAADRKVLEKQSKLLFPLQ